MPPPKPSEALGLGWGAVVAAVVVCAGVGVVILLSGMEPCCSLPFVLALIAIVGAAFYARAGRSAWQSWQAREAEFAQWTKHPVAALLASQWTSITWLPHSDVALAAIQQVAPGAAPCARVICFGQMDIPQVGDDRFEPVIMTPTDLRAKGLGSLVAAAVVFGAWALGRVGWVPMLSGLPWPMLIAYGAAGILGSIIWAWRTGVRPAYVRLAPGMVQVLQYGLLGSRPRIRSYPMTGGTVVVVGNSRPKPNPMMSVVLLRDGQRDRIAFLQMRRPAEALERFWRAVLSTAPTPPLSEEGLLG